MAAQISEPAARGDHLTDLVYRVATRHLVERGMLKQRRAKEDADDDPADDETEEGTPGVERAYRRVDWTADDQAELVAWFGRVVLVNRETGERWPVAELGPAPPAPFATARPLWHEPPERRAHVLGRGDLPRAAALHRTNPLPKPKLCGCGHVHEDPLAPCGHGVGTRFGGCPCLRHRSRGGAGLAWSETPRGKALAELRARSAEPDAEHPRPPARGLSDAEQLALASLGSGDEEEEEGGEVAPVPQTEPPPAPETTNDVNDDSNPKEEESSTMKALSETKSAILEAWESGDSAEVIGEKVGKSPKTVYGILTELRKLGMVKREAKRGRPAGSKNAPATKARVVKRAPAAAALTAGAKRAARPRVNSTEDPIVVRLRERRAELQLQIDKLDTAIACLE